MITRLGKLKRHELPTRTDGILIIYDENDKEIFFCRTMELPYLDNQLNISCIKKFHYLVTPDNTGHQQYFKVQNVEGRTGIEFHPAGYIEDLEGCISVYTKKHNNADGSITLTDSRETCKKLKELCPDGFVLVIS